MTTVAEKGMTKEAEYAAVAEKVRSLGFQVPAKGAWQQRIGAMQDSPHFEEAVHAGAEWRSQENRKSLEEMNADS